MSAGVTSLVSRRFGERKLEEVHTIADNAITLPIVLGIAVGAACIAFSPSREWVWDSARWF